MREKNENVKIQVASVDDAEELLAIYAPYVEKTAITFEYEIPSIEEFKGRIAHVLERFPYLKAVEAGKILGYAYVSPFKERAVQMAETQREQKRRLAEATERNEELNTLIKKLYEGNATGKIPDKHFERLLADYDREQTALETEIEDLQEQIDSFDEDNTKADKFIAVVRRYTDFTELTTPMLNEFIEKVVVHEATGGRTDRKQKIDVYFNFVGQVELPPDRA